jgi:hypothetical protein
MYCANCGSKIDERARFCEYCGTEIYTLETESSQSNSEQSSSSKNSTQYSSTIKIKVQKPENGYNTSLDYPVSPKSRLIALLLLLFLGSLGVHYFYVGRIGMGILWLLTGGLFGIGLLIDFIVILTGTFKDSFGRPILNWEI